MTLLVNVMHSMLLTIMTTFNFMATLSVQFYLSVTQKLL